MLLGPTSVSAACSYVSVGGQTCGLTATEFIWIVVTASALRNYRLIAVTIIVLLYCCKECEQNRQSEGEALTIASVSTTMYLN